MEKSMVAKTINLQNVCMVERIGPNYSDFHFKLKFWGETPGGKDMHVIIDFPAWGVEHLAGKLHEIQKEHERLVANSRQVLQGR
jgi:hypothetical protein